MEQDQGGPKRPHRVRLRKPAGRVCGALAPMSLFSVGFGQGEAPHRTLTFCRKLS